MATPTLPVAPASHSHYSSLLSPGVASKYHESQAVTVGFELKSVLHIRMAANSCLWSQLHAIHRGEFPGGREGQAVKGQDRLKTAGQVQNLVGSLQSRPISTQEKEQERGIQD